MPQDRSFSLKSSLHIRHVHSYDDNDDDDDGDDGGGYIHGVYGWKKTGWAPKVISALNFKLNGQSRRSLAAVAYASNLRAGLNKVHLLCDYLKTLQVWLIHDERLQLTKEGNWTGKKTSQKRST